MLAEKRRNSKKNRRNRYIPGGKRKSYKVNIAVKKARQKPRFLIILL